MTHHIDTLKTATDIAAASVTVATILQWLPALAALFTIIWTAIRIYEAARGKPLRETRVMRWLFNRHG